jgi:hypothetical protein
MTAKRTAPFLAPILIGVAGIAWMQCAVSHYRRLTGRGFYSLAGYHYSLPEWGFMYYPGGEVIHRWTTIFPSYVTAASLLFSLVVAIVAARSHGPGQIARSLQSTSWWRFCLRWLRLGTRSMSPASSSN